MLRRLWLNFKEKWWLAIVTAAIGAALFWGYAHLQNDVYSSAAVVYVQPAEGTTNIGTYDLQKLQMLIKDYRRFAGTARVTSDVRELLSKKDSEKNYNYLGSIAIIPDPEARFFTIIVQHSDRLMAAEVADAMAEVLVQISEDFIPSSAIKIIDHAVAPKAPIAPNRLRIVLTGLFLGVALGIAIIYLFYLSDRTIHNAEEFEKMFNMTPLGLIPTYTEEAGKNAKKKRLGLRFGRPNPLKEAQGRKHYKRIRKSNYILEAFKMLKTNLDYYNVDKRLQILVATSSIPDEGKSTVVNNLAQTFAEGGKRTLIIDMDLRRPVQHKIYGIKKPEGLSTVILKDTAPEEAVFPTELENLYVMPLGFRPPNPAALLESNAMKELMSYLRKRFDMIIIDSAPTLNMSDAPIIAAFSDAVLMVVSANNVDYRYVKLTMKNLSNVNAESILPVLNNISTDTGMYNYRYRYSGKYYGYGEREN